MIVDVSDHALLTRVSVGNLVAIRGASTLEFLIGIVDRVTRDTQEEANIEQETDDGDGGGGSGSPGGSGGGGGGSSLVPPGGIFAMDTTGVPMVQITVPTPVKEESKNEEAKKEETLPKTASTSPTTLTQPMTAAPIPTTGPSGVTPPLIKHEWSKAQLLAKDLAKCKKVKNKRKRVKCVAAAKKRYLVKKK